MACLPISPRGLKLALIGYGKMGKAVEDIALKRGHKIVFASSFASSAHKLNTSEVVIEFSKPEVAFENIKICLKNHIPVVSGTTGWLEKFKEVESLCRVYNGSFLYSSNFSLGMNIFFEINRKLARFVSPLEKDFKVEIREIHHVQKLDSPSGTSISLAKEIRKKWIFGKSKKKDKISIIAKRVENVTGIHTVTYRSAVDEIKIIHKAYSRKGFAIGAVLASEWIVNKKGFFSLKNVIQW
jgi:4-hydroxy-tetrahydrodipicolinate reductase